MEKANRAGRRSRRVATITWWSGRRVKLFGAAADIFAARVAADGTPLDATPIAVCQAKGFQIYPAVAFDGTNYLVAWSDFRGGQDWDVYAARVTPQGKLLDPDGFPVAVVPGNQAYATVASDRQGSSLVAWSDVRPQPDRPQAELYQLWGTLLRDGNRRMWRGTCWARRQLRFWPRPSSGTAPPSSSSPAVAAMGSRPASPLPSRSVPRARPCPSRSASATRTAWPPIRRRTTLVWSNHRREHGAYSTQYATSIYTDGKPTGGSRVLGLQSTCARRRTNSGAPWRSTARPSSPWWSRAPTATTRASSSRSPQPSSWPALGSTRPAANRWTPARGCRSARRRETAAAGSGEAKKAIRVAAEPKVQLRHPAIASLGAGRSLLVYSRHGGIDRFKIQAVLLDNPAKQP